MQPSVIFEPPKRRPRENDKTGSGFSKPFELPNGRGIVRGLPPVAPVFFEEGQAASWSNQGGRLQAPIVHQNEGALRWNNFYDFLDRRIEAVPAWVGPTSRRHAAHAAIGESKDFSVAARPRHDAPKSVHSQQRPIIAKLPHLRAMRAHRLQFAPYDRADILRAVIFGERGLDFIAQQSWFCDSGVSDSRLNNRYGCSVVPMKIAFVRQIDDLRLFPFEDGFESLCGVGGILFKVLVRPPQESYRGNAQYTGGIFRLPFSHSPGVSLRQIRQAHFAGGQENSSHTVTPVSVQADRSTAADRLIIGMRSNHQDIHTSPFFFLRSKTTRQSFSMRQANPVRRWRCSPA